MAINNPYDSLQALPQNVNAESQNTSQGLVSGAMGYTPATRSLDSNQTVQGQVESILAGDSPLMQRARSTALQQMNKRGLVNSSMAIGAGQAAMMDAALPIASQDASAYNQAASENLGYINQAKQFGASAANQFGLQGNEFAFQRGENKLNREQQLQLQEAQQKWQTGERLGAQDFELLQQNNQNTFAAQQSTLDREHQTLLQTLQQKWQTGERLAGEEFQSVQNALTREMQIAQAEADRQLQLTLQSAQQKFLQGQQLTDQEFQATQAALQRDFQIQQQQSTQEFQAKQQAEQNAFTLEQMGYSLNLQQSTVPSTFAATISSNTMSQVQAILGDPNLTDAAKKAAIDNATNYANQTLAWASTFYGTDIPNLAAPGTGTTSTSTSTSTTSPTTTTSSGTTSPTYYAYGDETGGPGWW